MLMKIIGMADGVHSLPQKSYVEPVSQEVILFKIGPAVGGRVTDVLTDGGLRHRLIYGEVLHEHENDHI